MKIACEMFTVSNERFVCGLFRIIDAVNVNSQQKYVFLMHLVKPYLLLGCLFENVAYSLSIGTVADDLK